MQTCYNCGKQVEDNVLICPDCGALVKRYTTVPKREPEQTEEVPPQQEGKRLYVDADGVLRMKTGLKVWLTVTTVLAGFLLFSFAVLLFAFYNQDLYVGALEMMPPEAAAMLPVSAEEFSVLFTEIMLAIGEDLWMLYAILVLLAGKIGADIWLLSGKKKAAVVTLLCVCLALALFLMLFGYANYALYVSVDGFVTSLLLRKDRALLR